MLFTWSSAPTLPAGVIFMWTGPSCPPGSVEHNLDGKFLRASSTYNADAGGSTTHSHTIDDHSHSGGSHSHGIANHQHHYRIIGPLLNYVGYDNDNSTQDEPLACTDYDSCRAEGDSGGASGATGSTAPGSGSVDGGAFSISGSAEPLYSNVRLCKVQ